MARTGSLPLIAVAAALLAGMASLPYSSAQTSPAAVRVSVDWGTVERVSRTSATLQVVVNPLLRRGSRIHDAAFRALRDLGADDVRFVPWLPYPRLAVAELEPPRKGRTSWDLSLIDPLVSDFMEATSGHPVVLNFSTSPQWMWKTPAAVAFPRDPDEVTWTYTQGRELNDPGAAELAGYYARLASWYARGGFTDELGRTHRSDHRYAIPWWEVLNEPDLEHELDGQAYTRIYDAVVAAVHSVSPQTRFVGASLAFPRRAPEFFEHFLDPTNHAPGVPLDAVSYHFYASPSADQPREAHAFTAFEEADHFLTGVRFIERMRQRLSPGTRTMVNEVGMIADHLLSKDGRMPAYYWNLASAVYAYLWSRLSELGIEDVGESQLVGYPTQFPSVTMLDWETGRPNARYWTLRLLRERFAPGDALVATRVDGGAVHARGFLGRAGTRRLLLVNLRDRVQRVAVGGAPGESLALVAGEGDGPATARPVAGDTIELPPFAVAVLEPAS
ncbi:MAG TPA: glycosyl hydrolase family 39 [Vicinamibacteria bacterium]|nr:glycosyl hydrolase family 39 [Vicinamibacteria bacterium]